MDIDLNSGASAAGNATAALALVKFLIDALHSTGKLDDADVQQIIRSAAASLPRQGHQTGDEARKVFRG